MAEHATSAAGAPVSTPSPTSPFIVQPTAPHTHSLILLHGLGSNGEKFGSELLATGTTSDGLKLTDVLPFARFIFPTSRRRRSSAFGRSMLTQWFDIARLQDPSYRKGLQLKGLEESAQVVLALLREEVQTSKVSPQNIILGGISQGCAMSLSVLLALDYPVGGFIGLCGYLPFQQDIDDAIENAVAASGSGSEDDFFEEEAGDAMKPEPGQSGPAIIAAVFERDLLCLSPAMPHGREGTAQATPIFLGHGSADEKVPLILCEAMAATLTKAEYHVKVEVYEGLGHWYRIPEEIDDIVAFVRSLRSWNP